MKNVFIAIKSIILWIWIILLCSSENWRKSIPVIKSKPILKTSYTSPTISLPVKPLKAGNDADAIDLKVGQIKTSLKIISISERGEGISIYDSNYTIRVPNTLVDEIVSVKISKVARSYSEANLLSVEKASPHRIVNPNCTLAMECGGCQLQYQTYDSQLKLKQTFVQQAFATYWKSGDTDVNDVAGSKLISLYRNKAQFTFKRYDKSIALGLYKRKTHDVVNTNKCEIQHDFVNQILSKLQIFFRDHSDLSVYDEVSRRGAFRHIVIRVGFATEEVMVCLVTATEQKSTKYLNEFITLMKSLDFIKSVLLHVNSKPIDNVLDNDIDNDGASTISVLHGKSSITDVIAGVKVKVSLFSFTQSNPQHANVLYNTVLQFCALKGDEVVYDLFCGIGIIGLYLSRHLTTGRVYGVEDCEEAIQDALYNKELNDMTNIDFVCGKAERVMGEYPSPSDPRVGEVVILNPPRKGVHISLLREISRRRVKKVVYVSCNPHTLARDVSELTKLKYCVKTIQPVDMFPHTVHVETVVLLERHE